MPDHPDLAGYKLVESGTLMTFDVVSTDIRPTPSDDDKVVEIELQLDEDLLASCALGFMFVLCLQSFHHGRPRGISGAWFEDDDEFTVEDFLDNLRYSHGNLYIFLDYVRGRCLKTTITIGKDGKCQLQTYNRGEALTRWVDLLRGKKFLEPVPSPGGAWSNKITPEFADNRDRFETAFPAAHEFLLRLEAEGPSHDLWLSTATNAHLYKRDGFLAYVKLRNPESAPPTLVLSPNFNNRIVDGTTDQSSALFPERIDALVDEASGVREGWAIRRSGGAVELTAATPPQFFENLIEALVDVDAESSRPG
ncbi:MAG: hypothetical protein RIF41_10180 [Polyangiaceae bacterium]